MRCALHQRDEQRNDSTTQSDDQPDYYPLFPCRLRPQSFGVRLFRLRGCFLRGLFELRDSCEPGLAFLYELGPQLRDLPVDALALGSGDAVTHVTDGEGAVWDVPAAGSVSTSVTLTRCPASSM